MTERESRNKMIKKVLLLIIFTSSTIFASADQKNSEIDDPNDLQTLNPPASVFDIHHHQLQQQTTNNNSLIEEENLLPSNIFNHTNILSSELDGLLDNDKPHEFYSFPVKILLSTLATTTSLITISGNLLVIFSFFIDHQIRNPTNYFLLSLSISDFLIGVFSMPLYTLYLMMGRWPFGKIICNLWLSLDYTVCLTSIYTVLFITIDRFCSVKIPAKYRKWRSRNKIIWMIILTWLIPMFLFFSSIFIWSWGTEFNEHSCDVGWSSNVTFALTLNIGYFWTTLTVMIVLYCFIYQVAKNLEQRSRNKARKVTSVVSHRHNFSNKQLANAMENSCVVPSQNIVELNMATNSENNDNNNTDISRVNGDNEYKLLQKSDPLDKLKQSHVVKALANGDFDTKKDNKNNKVTSDNSTGKSLKANENSSDEYSTVNGTAKDSNCIELTSVEKKENLKRYASNTSKDDEFSSSFDSHSDYETTKKKHQQQQQAFKSAIKKVGSKSNNKKSSLPGQNTNILNKNNLPSVDGSATFSAPYCNKKESIQSSKDLQPRPETLAVLSVDLFAEKCAQRPARFSPKLTDKTETDGLIKTQTDECDPSQIPYIEDDFDEVSYILHRRQFGNKEVNKQPIGEEIIVIKKVGFFQKLTTPLRQTSATIQQFKDRESNLLMESASITNLNEVEQKISKDNADKTKPEISKPVYSMPKTESANKIVLSSESSSKTPPPSVQNLLTVKTADKTTLVTSTAPKPKSGVSFHANSGTSKPKSKSKYENRARKALRTITFILGAFVFCWAPFHMVGIFDLFKNDICSWCDFANSTFYRHFYNTTYFLCYLNSPINPFCYALANQQFKKTFSRILKGDWRRT